nr:recombinase family protein [Nocardia brevicatena]
MVTEPFRVGYGYVRCSADEQDVEIQTEQLLTLAVPSERIFTDKGFSYSPQPHRPGQRESGRPRRGIQRRPLHHPPHPQRFHPADIANRTRSYCQPTDYVGLAHHSGDAAPALRPPTSDYMNFVGFSAIAIGTSGETNDRMSHDRYLAVHRISTGTTRSS